MKFTRMRLIGAQTVNLPIVGADPSGPFVFKGADGLGPADIEVIKATTSLGISSFQKRRPQDKQVIIRVGLQPEYEAGGTANDLRRQLYGMLSPRYGRIPRMELLDGNTVIAGTEGHISKFEIAPFAKDPEVQLTMETLSPYLLAPDTNPTPPVRTNVSGGAQLRIENVGDAPSGFTFAIRFTGPVAAPLILSEEVATGQKIKINDQAWAGGDIFTVDTRLDTIGVWRTPAGGNAKQAVLNDLSGDSEWLTLYEGTNILNLNTSAFDLVPGSFGHRPAYWGV